MARKKKRVVWIWEGKNGILQWLYFDTLKSCERWYGDKYGKPVKFVEA